MERSVTGSLRGKLLPILPITYRNCPSTSFLKQFPDQHLSLDEIERLLREKDSRGPLVFFEHIQLHPQWDELLELLEKFSDRCRVALFFSARRSPQLDFCLDLMNHDISMDLVVDGLLDDDHWCYSFVQFPNRVIRLGDYNSFLLKSDEKNLGTLFWYPEKIQKGDRFFSKMPVQKLEKRPNWVRYSWLNEFGESDCQKREFKGSTGLLNKGLLKILRGLHKLKLAWIAEVFIFFVDCFRSDYDHFRTRMKYGLEEVVVKKTKNFFVFLKYLTLHSAIATKIRMEVKRIHWRYMFPYYSKPYYMVRYQIRKRIYKEPQDFPKARM